MITSGSVDDRKTVPEMCKDLTGKLIGDKGYILLLAESEKKLLNIQVKNSYHTFFI